MPGGRVCGGAPQLLDPAVVRDCGGFYLATEEPLPVYEGADMLAWIAVVFLLVRCV